jgi:hypothetical protein
VAEGIDVLIEAMACGGFEISADCSDSKDFLSQLRAVILTRLDDHDPDRLQPFDVHQSKSMLS